MIDVLKLHGLDHEDVVKLLTDSGGPFYKIRIPRSGQLPHDTRNEKAFDYLRAAYVGQELSDVSEEFDYDALEPDEMGDITFDLKTRDISGLANKLLGISFLFSPAIPSQDQNVAMIINTLLDRIKEERIEPACGYFIEYYIDLTI